MSDCVTIRPKLPMTVQILPVIEEAPDQSEKSSVRGNVLSPQSLMKIIDSDRKMYYRTKELNDKLFIHYGGWGRMENLSEFTGLKVLYAECNSFTKIEGLDSCTQLRSLFLNQNCISKIEGLDSLDQLWSLNLSDNFISKIENIQHLQHLNTLILANNKIGVNGLSDLQGLIDTPITCLDLQNNKIDDPAIVEEVLTRMPNLSVLYLKNNPVVKKIQNYRKRLIVDLTNLKFLDDRPVFEDERRCCEAWAVGGMDAEKAERLKIQREKETEYERNAAAFQAMIDEAKDNHRERQLMRTSDKYTDETDPVDTYERIQQRYYREHASRFASSPRNSQQQQRNTAAIEIGTRPVRANTTHGWQDDQEGSVDTTTIGSQTPRDDTTSSQVTNELETNQSDVGVDTSSCNSSVFDFQPEDRMPELEPVSPQSNRSSIQSDVSSIQLDAMD